MRTMTESPSPAPSSAPGRRGPHRGHRARRHRRARTHRHLRRLGRRPLQRHPGVGAGGRRPGTGPEHRRAVGAHQAPPIPLSRRPGPAAGRRGGAPERRRFDRSQSGSSAAASPRSASTAPGRRRPVRRARPPAGGTRSRAGAGTRLRWPAAAGAADGRPVDRSPELHFRAMASEVHVILVDSAPGRTGARAGPGSRSWTGAGVGSTLTRSCRGRWRTAGSEVAVSADTLTLLATMSRGVRRHRRPLRPDDAPTGRRRGLRRQHRRRGAAVGRLSTYRTRAAARMRSDSMPTAARCRSPRAWASTPAASARALPQTWWWPSSWRLGPPVPWCRSVATSSPRGQPHPTTTAGGWRSRTRSTADRHPGRGRARRWRCGDLEHAEPAVVAPWIDRPPRAGPGAPGTVARTDLATVTAMAGTGWQAEAHATAALIRGQRRGR